MSGIEDLFKQQSETATDEPDAPASEPEGDQEDWQPADADNRRPEWLEDETPVVLEAEAAEAPTETEAKGEKEDASPASELPQRDEKGRFTKDEPASHQVPLEAMLHERERRQKAERELEELRNAQAKETDEEAPDFFDDPKKAVTSTVKRELQAERETLLTEAERRARELFFQYTERAARKQFPDYDEARAVFAEEVQRNPMLQQQLAQADDPASFVYEQGRTIRELREVGGNLTEYRKRVEAEAFERFKAEQSAKRNRTANVPKSLNTEPSKGAGVEGGQWAGPTPLFDILPNKME